MLTMAAALDRARSLYPRRPAIVEPDRTYAWSEHVERVERAAGVLAALGLQTGERFGVLGRNSFRQCELVHAGYWSGFVPVPVNFRLAAPEMAFVLDDAGCRALAVDPALVGALDRPELAAWKTRAFVLGSATEAGGLPAYEALLARAAPRARSEVDEGADAILLYTGGTTGRAKGVRLTQRNIVSNGLQVGLTLGIRDDDVYLHVAPMFHSADLLATAVTLRGGAHAYLAEFNPEAWLNTIQRTHTTFTMLAPTMLMLVLQRPDFAHFDLSSLRIQVYGSAPMAESWIRRAVESLPGAQVVQGYGLTETAPILTFLEHRHHREALEHGDAARLASAGKPLPAVELRIVDDDGRVKPTGSSGEVVVRGPNVTPGYFNLPGENAASFRDGWFHTGDVGRVDDEGFLYLLDRKKDVIVTGGENVYSSEVEAALYQHPDVAEVAVIAVSDELYGETVFAAVVRRPGSAVEAPELVAHCRTHIGGFKIPRQFAFVDSLPKSAVGKVLKAELRRRYGSR
jgi:long-chain acyl-CoA synthetase